MKTAPTGKQSARAKLTWELRRLRRFGTRRRLWIVAPRASGLTGNHHDH